jgi:hypothetical protein
MPLTRRPKPMATLTTLVLAMLAALVLGTGSAAAAEPGLNVGGLFFFSNPT